MTTTAGRRQVDGDTSISSEAKARSIAFMFVGWLIISGAASPAVALWAANPDGIPKAHRLVLVAASFALIGAITCLGLSRLLSDLRIAAFITFIAVLMVTSGAQVLGIRSWVWQWGAAFLMVALFSAIVIRLRDWWLVDAMLAAFSVSLLLPGLITGTWQS